MRGTPIKIDLGQELTLLSVCVVTDLLLYLSV
jgi:hypothetical protein